MPSAQPIYFDRRGPKHYRGDWRRSLSWRDPDWAREDLDDPHVKRKLTIMKDHPEIAELYSAEPWTQLITWMVAAVQLTAAYGIGRVWQPSWPMFLAVAYVLGGTMTHLSGIIMHECCHNLVCEWGPANRLYALLSNLPIPVPVAASFRRYHLEHHTFQGVEGRDPDLPLPFELRLIRGGTVNKFIWMFFYPLMYLVRGAAFGYAPSKHEIINWAFTAICDVIIYQICGWKGLFYLFASLWLGYSFHPVAAHFIQEHYTYVDGQETYSYYGWSNWFFLNIGFHNEHHDFPKVPWSKLPQLRSLGGRAYTDLAAHHSWRQVLWSFLTDRNMGPQSRVVRSLDDWRTARKDLGKLNK